jgi:hypothetical protein
MDVHPAVKFSPKFKAVKTFFIMAVVILILPFQVFCQGPVKVSLQKNGFSFQLFRGGLPFYIKGGGGYHHLDVLAQAGGNSLRIWEHDRAKEILDEAQKLGLTVMVGLWVAHERHGFDYNDADAIQKQLEKFKTVVLELKDHPALLLWAVGNEVNLNYRNMNVWYAVEDIAKMIHDLDKNHPTVTVISGVHANDLLMIKDRCPSIDILGVNTYSGLKDVPEKIREYDWDKPYIITEWGPIGQWETERTNWEAPIEQTSTEKATLCKKLYENTILKDADRCLGAYLFMWGNKQEMTATWYSTFLETGESTALVDLMEYEWTGKTPTNTAPQINTFLLNGGAAKDNVRLMKPGENKAIVNAIDNEQDSLKYEWEILHESEDLKEGGDKEEKPFKLDDIYKTGTKNELIFNTPERRGQYRLFVYIYDGHNKVATANIPFYVRKH